MMYHTYYTTNNFEVWVGKNSSANEILTFELSKHNDLWFHTKDCEGAHVILRKDASREFKEVDLQDAARFAVQHSKQKTTTCVYTECINVEKPKRSRKGTVILSQHHEIVIKNEN